MDVNKGLGIVGTILIAIAVVLFFNKQGGLGFISLLLGLGLYIYSRRDKDFRSM